MTRKPPRKFIRKVKAMANNLLGVLKIIAPGAPRQMVVGTNYSAPVQYEDSHRVDVNIITAPAATGSPVSHYEIFFEGAERIVRIQAGAPMPAAVDFTPTLYPDIWQWGVASWSAKFRIRAVAQDGSTGVLSAVTNVTIDQDDGYFIPNADWTFSEERDSTAAGGVAGRGRVSIPSNFAVPAGVTLRSYIGTMNYADSESHDEIHSALNSPVLVPGTARLGEGNSLTNQVFAVLLYEGPIAGQWHQASNVKSFIVQGLINTGAPQVVTPPSVTGTGKIGAALTRDLGVWSPTPSSYTTAWLVNGAAMSPAQTGASYTPVAADDGKTVSVRVTANGDSGSTPYESAGVLISYVAPAVVNAIPDKSWAQSSGAYQSVDITNVFSGSNLTITISGPNASDGTPLVSYNADTKSLSFNISSALAAATVRVTATNSGAPDGTVYDELTFTVTAVGTASVPEVIGVGGSNSAGSAYFTNYITDDGIFAAVRANSGAGWTKPDLAAWTGEKDWVEIFYLAGSGQTVGLYLRRCDGIGTDGSLGDWGIGRPTYVSVRGLDWADPVGAISTADALTTQTAKKSLDHPALTPEGLNSIILDIAYHASAITNQAPGLRPDATLIVQSTAGIRKTLSRLPTPATAVSARLAVDHTVITNDSGVQNVALVELKGSASASSMVWPAAIAQTKIVASEITSTAEAATAGYANESGHIKVVVASDCPLLATTTSGDFELVREFMGAEGAAPPATGNQIVAGNWISSGRRTIGVYLYTRAYWRHIASGAMRVAWSQAPIQIMGFPSSIDRDILAFAYTKKGGLRYNAKKDTMDSPGIATDGACVYYAPILPYAAYAAYSGSLSGAELTACYDFVEAEINKTLGPDINTGKNWDPSMQMGYGTQHLGNWCGAVAFAKATPGLWARWAGTTAAETLAKAPHRARIDALMKAAGWASRGTWREGSDGQKNMLGYANATTTNSNPNIGCAPEACFYAYCWYMGGIAAGDAWLDANDITDMYALLNGLKLTNCALSFSATRQTTSDGTAPSLSSTQTKARSQNRWGFAVTDPFNIFKRDIEFTYGRAVKRGYENADGSIGVEGRGKMLFDPEGTRDQTVGTLTPATYYTVAEWAALQARWNAIKDLPAGRCREFESADTSETRSSYEYAVMAAQVNSVCALVMMGGGFITPAQMKTAGFGTLMATALEYYHLASPYGFGYMQKDKNADRDWYPNSTGLDHWQRWVVAVRLDLMKQAVNKIQTA